MRGRSGTLVVGFVAATLLFSGVARAYGPNCAPAKLRAAARKATMKVACYRTALQSGEPLDQSCLGRAEARFIRAFAAAERRGGCTTTGDAGDVEAIVDQFIADLLAHLTPGSTSTSTSTTSSSSASPSTSPTISCVSGGMCSAGLSCGSNGEVCRVAPPCTCGGSSVCLCSNTTFTTCTMPTCPTTSTSLP